MTLQEIFNSVRFKDLREYLIDIKTQVSENLYAFKEAFDILCMMKPKEGMKVPIKVDNEIYQKKRGGG